MLQKITLFILIVLACACKKEDQPKQNIDYFIKASKNDVDWITEQEGFTVTGNADSLTIAGSVGKENLLLKLTKNSQAQYVPDTKNTAFFTLLSGDVVNSSYKLDSKTTNTITITELDLTKKEVKGTFNLTFKKVTGDSSIPAKLIFTNGEIYAAKYSVF